MEFKLLSALYKDLSTDNFCFFYRGEFSDQITAHLFNISDSKLGDNKEQSSIRKKVNFLMVECIQNIERHGVIHPDLDTSLGYFSLRSREPGYFLTSANIISEKIIPDLKSTLDHVNELSEEDLKKLYMQVLGQGELSEKGGAGLGIIEMARKSGNKLEYEFLPLKDGICYFYLQLSIAQNKGENVEPLPMKDSLRFHKALLDHNIQFLYYGYFNNETIKPIAYTLEHNLNVKGDVDRSRILFHVLVELLQNIARYSIGDETNRYGLFAITIHESHFNILAANLVDDNMKVVLTDILENANSNNKSIVSRHGDLAGNDDEMALVETGFLEIAHSTSHGIHYNFEAVGKDWLFELRIMV